MMEVTRANSDQITEYVSGSRTVHDKHADRATKTRRVLNVCARVSNDAPFARRRVNSFARLAVNQKALTGRLADLAYRSQAQARLPAGVPATLAVARWPRDTNETTLTGGHTLTSSIHSLLLERPQCAARVFTSLHSSEARKWRV